MSGVDFHWHARDGSQSAKETIERSLAVARASGLDAIAAMPNTSPPLVTEEDCKSYLSVADKVKSPIQFFVHIGLTSNAEQVRRAVQATRNNERIIGIKGYFGRSTGNLAIIDEAQQLTCLNVLAQEGYTGVLVAHCEDESKMDERLYDPKNPKTWSTLCRPEIAEISSFEKIQRMCEVVGFQGKLHVAHVSTTDVVDAIASYQGNVKLSCGVTPHHLFFDWSKLEGLDGAHYKCNPPLRSPKTRAGLLERFMRGRIRILESDHAPHCESEKMSAHPPSGISIGSSWPYIKMHLAKIGMSTYRLEEATFDNALKLYGLEGKVIPSRRRCQWEKLEALQATYPFDAFKDLKQLVK